MKISKIILVALPFLTILAIDMGCSHKVAADTDQKTQNAPKPVNPNEVSVTRYYRNQNSWDEDAGGNFGIHMTLKPLIAPTGCTTFIIIHTSPAGENGDGTILPGIFRQDFKMSYSLADNEDKDINLSCVRNNKGNIIINDVFAGTSGNLVINVLLIPPMVMEKHPKMDWKNYEEVSKMTEVQAAFSNPLDGDKDRSRIMTTQVKRTIGAVVTIGSQIWTTKNLNVTRFRNGDPIYEAKTNEDIDKAGKEKKPACFHYPTDPDGTQYGRLYNWYAVNDSRGLAPQGFHIPSSSEWTTLVNYLGGEMKAAQEMKTENGGWSTPGNNSSGFSAIAAMNEPSPLGQVAYFWTTSERDKGIDAVAGFIRADAPQNSNLLDQKQDWESLTFSVRCIQDQGQPHTNTASAQQVNDTIFKNATVITDKAYFYSFPDDRNKEKSYMVKGEQAKYNQDDGYFIYVVFTNTKGVETKGYMLRANFSLN